MTHTNTLPGSTTPTPGVLSRITAVVRLHFVNLWTILVVPLIILLVVAMLNVAIWIPILAAIPDKESRADALSGFSNTGAIGYVFIYMMVVAIQAFNLTFPYALGYGVTRRNFYVGSAVAFAALALVWSVMLTALWAIEDATNGWFIGGRIFAPNYFTTGNVATQFVLYFLTLLFFFFVGGVVAALYVRWKANGLLGFFVLLALLIIGAIALATYTQSWGAVGDWFVRMGPLGVAAWSLVPTAIASLAGFAVLRRATPGS